MEQVSQHPFHGNEFLETNLLLNVSVDMGGQQTFPWIRG
jgi:hypothetical protein